MRGIVYTLANTLRSDNAYSIAFSFFIACLSNTLKLSRVVNNYFHSIDLIIDSTLYKNNLSCCSLSKKGDHCEVLRTNSCNSLFFVCNILFQFSKCFCFNSYIITFNSFDEISNCLFYNSNNTKLPTFLFLLLRLFVAFLLFIMNKNGYYISFLLLTFSKSTILPLQCFYKLKSGILLYQQIGGGRKIH